MWGPLHPFSDGPYYVFRYISYLNMKMLEKTNIFHPKTNGNFFPIYFSELVQNAVHKGHNANDNLQGYGVRKSEVTR